MNDTSGKRTILEQVITSPWLLVAVLPCLALLAKYKARALLVPMDWSDWFAVITWGVCAVITGVSVLFVGRKPSDGADDTAFQRTGGANLLVPIALSLIAVGTVLVFADVAMVVNKSGRSHLGDRIYWYVMLSIGLFSVAITCLDSTGRIKSKRWRRFLFGDSWWERRKKRRQNRK
jgi:hypothetical protein